MKIRFKLTGMLFFLFAFTLNAEAQKKDPKKAKKEMVKQLHLSKQQKKEMKAVSLKKKKEAVKNNSALTEQQKKDQLAQLKNDKHAKMEAILTPEQKEKIKEAKDNKPRRGVTGMPNERTAK